MQPYELIRSGRRTLALELRGGRVIVRAPYRTPQATIDRFVADNECRLTVLPGGEHWFHTEAQLAALRAFEAEALS